MKRKKIKKTLRTAIKKAEESVNILAKNDYYIGLIHAYDYAISLLNQKRKK